MAERHRVAGRVAAQTPLTSSNAPCAKPTGKLSAQGLTEMDVKTLRSMTPQQRLAWYGNQLNSYSTELQNSAACNGIPQQLLATVILNELADINWQDVWQQRLSSSGSLGVAQIQVSTAKSHKLVEYSGEKTLDDSTIAKRLTIPQYAIEAAAREIKHLIDQMTQNLANPWQGKFSFSLTSLSQLKSPNDIYQYVKGGSPRDKELNLAELVVAAYNSPDIIIAAKPASIDRNSSGFVYRNGTIHGGNARYIAGELYDNNLFH